MQNAKCRIGGIAYANIKKFMPKAYLHFAFCILHFALNQVSFSYFYCLSQLRKPSRFTAGDKDLTFYDLIQDEILPAGIQLGKDIVQQQHRLFAPFSAHEFPLGQFQTDGRGAGLALGAVGLQIDTGQGILFNINS